MSAPTTTERPEASEEEYGGKNADVVVLVTTALPAHLHEALCNIARRTFGDDSATSIALAAQSLLRTSIARLSGGRHG